MASTFIRPIIYLRKMEAIYGINTFSWLRSDTCYYLLYLFTFDNLYSSITKRRPKSYVFHISGKVSSRGQIKSKLPFDAIWKHLLPVKGSILWALLKFSPSLHLAQLLLEGPRQKHGCWRLHMIKPWFIEVFKITTPRLQMLLSFEGLI